MSSNYPIPARRQRYQRSGAAAVVVLALFLSTAAVAQTAGDDASTLSVVTINMAKVQDPERVLREWRTHPDIWNSGVVLLQEVVHYAGGRPSVAQTLAKEMGRYVVSAPSVANQEIDGLAIISRYPLTDVHIVQLTHNDMVFHTRSRIAMAATVHTPWGPLRVYNVHLDSRVNARTRLKQIAPIISEAAGWDGPRLIGGDFNTNYLRWAGNVIPIGLSLQARAISKEMASRSFTASEDHSGPTSDFMRLHLDWVYTRDVPVMRTAVQPLRFSDHHAVIATLGQFAAPADGPAAAGSR
jgi:endonuclease/exonuclease/phosphatase family metal-dependent hydrolase